MKALVTTRSCFFLYDLKSREISIIDKDKGPYYGITFSKDRIFVGCIKNKGRYQGNNSILVFDLNLKLKREMSSPILSDIHQIQYFENKIFCCSTAFNGLAFFNFETNEWNLWRPFENVKKDFHHFNSILIEDESSVFLNAMRYDINEERHGAILHCDLTSENILRKFIIGNDDCHNILKIKDELFVLSSNEGAVKSTKNFTKKIDHDAWLRGMAYLPEEGKILVGASPKQTIRKLRKSSTPVIKVFDLSWNILENHEIKGLGDITEIRVPGYKDKCHSLIGKKV